MSCNSENPWQGLPVTPYSSWLCLLVKKSRIFWINRQLSQLRARVYTFLMWREDLLDLVTLKICHWLVHLIVVVIWTWIKNSKRNQLGYSGIPPYGRTVYRDTLLLRPFYPGQSFSYLQNGHPRYYSRLLCPIGDLISGLPCTVLETNLY